MKKITILFAILLLAFNAVNAQAVFDFDTNAVDNGDNITETIDGITVTFQEDDSVGENSVQLSDWGGWLGSTANIVLTGGTDKAIFTFSEAVDVNSILPIDAAGADIDYTFTPTGGTNSPVVVSLVGGGGAPGLVPVDLNWTNVISFTITGIANAGMAFDNLSVTAIPPPTVFDFDTNAVDNGDNITETIDGITVTFQEDDSVGENSVQLSDWGGWLGSTANIVLTGGTDKAIFTFSEAVDVNSILPIDAAGADIDYTFTPTGGTNSPVVVSLVGGGGAPGLVPVDLNWTNVTSFTITGIANAGMAFDNLSVSSATSLSTDNYIFQKVKIYPNPVENILYIKNTSELKSVNLYNSLGQLILQSEEESIDVSQLSKGMYVLQINTSQGTETKRIIKK